MIAKKACRFTILAFAAKGISNAFSKTVCPSVPQANRPTKSALVLVSPIHYMTNKRTRAETLLFVLMASTSVIARSVVVLQSVPMAGLCVIANSVGALQSVHIKSRSATAKNAGALQSVPMVRSSVIARIAGVHPFVLMANTNAHVRPVQNLQWSPSNSPLKTSTCNKSL